MKRPHISDNISFIMSKESTALSHSEEPAKAVVGSSSTGKALEGSSISGIKSDFLSNKTNFDFSKFTSGSSKGSEGENKTTGMNFDFSKFAPGSSKGSEGFNFSLNSQGANASKPSENKTLTPMVNFDESKFPSIAPKGNEGENKTANLNILNIGSKPDDKSGNTMGFGFLGSLSKESNEFKFSPTSEDGNKGVNTFTAFSWGASTKLNFNFGTGKVFQADKSEFSKAFNISIPSFNTSGSMSIDMNSSQQQDEDHVDEEKNEFYESTEKTGEEDETILLNTTASLYVFKDKEYLNRGKGHLHFNYNEEHKFYRLVLRRENVGTVILNTRVFPQMKPQLRNKTALSFLCPINENKSSENQESSDTSKLEILMLRMQEENCKKLLELMKKAVDECK